MKIIAFEGLDASGKQTQTELLAKELKARGYMVVTESFPRYDKPIGQLILQWLKGEVELNPQAAHMLYDADRQDFARNIVAAESIGADYMILDRYSLSNIAFGMARGMDMKWMKSLQACYRQPDTTIILDVNSRVSFERKDENRDRNELDVGLLNRARAAYSFLPDNVLTDRNILTIDANGDVQDVHEAVMELFDNGFI